MITRHGPSNYGSLLQSFATQAILEQLGHKCEIIDYLPKHERGIRAAICLADKQGCNSLPRKIAYVAMRYPEEKIAEMKFDKMRSRLLKLTQRCSTHDDLKRLKADMFMTGSDQVWGPTLEGRHDEAYFLSFVKDCPKVAYAASFGKTDFTEDMLTEYKRLLSSYSKIAVREDSAVCLLEQMGIKCAGQVLDPTLLLTGEEWNQLIRKETGRDFVLVYQLHNNPQMDKYAKRFAQKVGLPLKRISPTFHQIKRGGDFIFLPDVELFLSYIKNCTYFITDSFHGTAFALNFNKQFIEILPNNKTGSRNLSILRLTQLQDRILQNYQDFSFKEKRIDYRKVNEILEEERKKSILILKETILTKI